MTTKSEILRTIRDKCLDCSCYQPQEVRLCPVCTCPLHPFRMGMDPNPSTTKGFAKTRVYAEGPEQQTSSNKKPRREGQSQQGNSPIPITTNDKDQKK